MIIRYIFLGIFFFTTMIIGWFVYPFIYPFFDKVYWNKTPILWWFLNSDEVNLEQNKYGDLYWRKRKGIKLNNPWNRFIASYRWNAIRNPHYNLKLKLVPRAGAPYNIKIHYDTTGKGGMTFCNEIIQGRQFATFRVDGQKQFRISATFKLLWWVQNYQFGMSENRYLYKWRTWSRTILNKR